MGSGTYNPKFRSGAVVYRKSNRREVVLCQRAANADMSQQHITECARAERTP